MEHTSSAAGVLSDNSHDLTRVAIDEKSLIDLTGKPANSKYIIYIFVIIIRFTLLIKYFTIKIQILRSRRLTNSSDLGKTTRQDANLITLSNSDDNHPRRIRPPSMVVALANKPIQRPREHLSGLERQRDSARSIHDELDDGEQPKQHKQRSSSSSPSPPPSSA